jgi:hypothetical protein
MIIERFLRRRFEHRDVSNYDRPTSASLVSLDERPRFYRAFLLRRSFFGRALVLTLAMKNLARGRWSFSSLRLVRGWSMSEPLKPIVRTMDDYRAAGN